MSRGISRRLARTNVTPNAITLFSTALGIAGALVLLRPSYAAGVAGAFLFLAHTVVDGCDGEIARLKFQTSRIGAALDLVGDNLVHAVLFPCLALRFHLRDPSGPYLWLGAAAVAGMVASWAAVWIVIVRGAPSAAERRVFEAFANREFAYLLFVLALAGRLEWFLWAMVFGIWAFPLALFVLSFSRRAPV
jgi:phosphatidylglycerophosphate synthase